MSNLPQTGCNPCIKEAQTITQTPLGTLVKTVRTSKSVVGQPSKGRGRSSHNVASRPGHCPSPTVLGKSSGLAILQIHPSNSSQPNPLTSVEYLKLSPPSQSTRNTCGPPVGNTCGPPPLKVTPSVPPSKLKFNVFQQALAKSQMKAKRRVVATGSGTSRTTTPVVITKRGPEEVLQQATTEKTVQRCPKGEYISKYVRSVDVDQKGQATQVEMTSQAIDPTHATAEAGVNEVISVTSQVSVTASGKQTLHFSNKKTLQASQLKGQLNMNPHQITRLVREEVEDVENTLKMVPPELILSSAPEMYPLKKRVQLLRLSSTSIGFLEQSVCPTVPTADEVDTEGVPELVASIVHGIERGVSPEKAPDQLFNTLFPDVKDEKIGVSSVVGGPLEDVVVPVDPRADFRTDEVMTQDMEATVQEVQNTLQPPRDDICFEKNVLPQPRPFKRNSKKPTMIAQEILPWALDDVNSISMVVGTKPIFTSVPVPLDSLNTHQEITSELTKGIDYFLEADTNPYETKVQLRGSRPPTWFPGYLSAFPHLPDLLQITRTPSRVLHTAWRAVQPKIFPEDSILIM